MNTDSSLLGDGVRVLEIARAARAKGRQSGPKLTQAYRRLLEATGRVVGQARRFAKEIDDGVKRAADIRRQVVLEGLRRKLERAWCRACGR